MLASSSRVDPLEDGYRLFFSARYEEAAALALTFRALPDQALASYELRTAALHFQLKRELAAAKDKRAALRACAACAGLLAELKQDIAAGRAAAHERIKSHPDDLEALFLLGKIDLTHVWLHLETLGQRTGWSEYWEARRSLDRVLERNPQHVRAKVARAWIDYIVDTKVPRGFRWMLGGGDRKGALEAARSSTDAQPVGFAGAEARFALWEMLTREKRMAEASVVGRQLAGEFPENRELARFLENN